MVLTPSSPGPAGYLRRWLPRWSTVLCGNLGFEGLVITDSLSATSISAAGYSVPRASAQSIIAGGDLVLWDASDVSRRHGNRSGDRPRGEVRRPLARQIANAVRTSSP